MRELKDIQTMYEGMITPLISQKALDSITFKNDMEEILKEINETSLRHLPISQKVNSYLKAIVKMFLNDSQIIKNYQTFVQAIFENLDVRDETVKSLEEKNQEQEEMLNEFRAKNEALKEELEEARRRIQITRGKDDRKKILKDAEEKLNYEELAVEYLAKTKKKKMPLYFFLKTKLKYMDKTIYERHKYHLTKQITLIKKQEDQSQNE